MNRELSKSRKQTLEEDFRNYHQLRSKGITALINAKWKPEDLNSWIKNGFQNQGEQLSTLLLKESCEGFVNWNRKAEAVERTMKRLPKELKDFVNLYLWGEYSYLSREEVANHKEVSRRTIYNWFDKIIYTYAEELGEIN